MTDADPTRRDVIEAAALGLAAAALPAVAKAQPMATTAAPDPGQVPLRLTINGVERTATVEPGVTLLDLMRERLGLTGTKRGCGHGQCGACTVLVDGKAVNSCLLLAVMQEGRTITTIEGLAGPDGTLHPLQAAFVRHDAFQCGYCTPGQIMSALAIIEAGRATDDEAIRGWMSGNLCRCGAYANIVEAVKEAAATMGAARTGRRT